MNVEELKNRTNKFAHCCVKLAMALPNNALANNIKGQLIRCSTSVAANYRACSIAQSKVSFIAKISIVAEESDESAFWLEFIIDEGLLQKDKVTSLFKEAEELTAIFISSRKTAQKNKLNSKNNKQ